MAPALLPCTTLGTSRELAQRSSALGRPFSIAAAFVIFGHGIDDMNKKTAARLRRCVRFFNRLLIMP
jgi:hypothetical protein